MPKARDTEEAENPLLNTDRDKPATHLPVEFSKTFKKMDNKISKLHKNLMKKQFKI